MTQILCTICARGGSKGVPGKNLRLLVGKPLIAHSIDHAREAGIFAAIAVSSDDDNILKTAQNAGADFLIRRPDELAADTAAKAPAIRHCVENVEQQSGRKFEIFVDLDATSPLRLPKDVVGAVKLLQVSGCSNVITGTSAHRSPYFNLVEMHPDGSVGLSKPLGTIVRRQDAPLCFDMNASVYVWTRAAMFAGPNVFRADTRLFEMPADRSHDIDSETDWEIVEFLMKRRQERSA